MFTGMRIRGREIGMKNLATVIRRKIVFIVGMIFAQIISLYILAYSFSNFDFFLEKIHFRFDIWNMTILDVQRVTYWLLVWNMFSGYFIFICLIFIFENFKPFMKLLFYLIIITQVISFIWSMSVSIDFGILMAAAALPPVFAALTRLRGWW
jgi:hypothetical protein